MAIEITFDQTVRQYLATKSAVDNATKTMKELENTIKAEMIGMEVSKYEVDNHTLCLVQAERRSFDADALKNLVNASVYRKITAVEVRTTLIDAAITLGQISPEVVDQVTTKTPYTQLRVEARK